MDMDNLYLKLKPFKKKKKKAEALVQHKDQQYNLNRTM